MKNPCHFASAILIIIASLGVTASIPGTAFSDSVVAGTITSVAGEKMAGNTLTYSVSIKARITNRRRISNFTRRNSQPISLARAAQARPL